MIEILSNGSRWHGQAPGSIEDLLKVLGREPLDPRFEKDGGFIEERGGGVIGFFGNFANVSHVFRIHTDEPETIAKLTAAIQSNRNTEQYQEALRGFLKERRESESYTWIIDEDHIGEGGAGTVGPRGANADPAHLAALSDRFRMFDDDGELYYSGRTDALTRASGFEPLDDFGTPNAGCTNIEYWIDGKWQQL